MKYFIIFILFIISFDGMAQNQDLNNYQYIVVADQYDFQSDPNQYRINDLAVFEFKKRNFTAFLSTELLSKGIHPESCDVLHLKMEKSGSLKRYLTLRLENCSGTVMFTSKKGVGTAKSNQKAYYEAFRDAMTSFDAVDYKYTKSQYYSMDQKSVGKEMGIDTLSIQTRQPDAKTNDTKPTELPKFDKKVNDTKVNGLDSMKSEDTLPLESEVVEHVLDKIYRTKSKEYFIISTETGFDIYKNKGLIGTLKKSKGGCYFVETNEFIGIAYKTLNGIFIEYTAFGKDQILKFVE